LSEHIIIYPAIQRKYAGLNFADQYAFRPSGSTAAALNALLHTVCAMLSSNSYIHVFALDFSKAFDSVRHQTLMEKVAKLDITDNTYNWIASFLTGHMHSTKYGNVTSSVATVTASIIQRSGIGPPSYLITAADLRPTRAGNDIVKYADDTYLIIPAANSGTCAEELNNIQAWASNNNLKLNCSKSKDI